MYGIQQALVAPLNSLASAGKAVWRHPLLSGTRLGRAAGAANEMVERATRHYAKPPFGLGPETVVVRTPFCNLIHFEREGASQDPRLLIVAPLSGHHASLLRDTVARLLPRHDVYLTDWVDARLAPLSAGRFDLDDYVCLVRSFLRKLGGDTHVLAVCQPCVPVLAAVALMAQADEPEQPRSLTLMAGPVDARINATEVGRYAASHSLDYFEAAAIQWVPAGEPGFMRRVYPGHLQLASFISMNPKRHQQAQAQFFRDLVDGNAAGAEAHRRFYNDYLAVMDLPAEYYLQTVERVFQTFDLARGEMEVHGEPVHPEAIRRTGLLTIEGEKDDITGLGQTAAAHALCSNSVRPGLRHYVQPGVGHYGVFSGRHWREEIAPHVEEFIRSF